MSTTCPCQLNCYFSPADNAKINATLTDLELLQEGGDYRDVYAMVDWEALKSTGVTPKQIADSLRHCTLIYQDFARVHGYTDCAWGIFRLSAVPCNGRIKPCPFQDKQITNGCDPLFLTVSNTLTNQSITFHTMLIHTIEFHHFFGSSSCPYHVDPVKTIELLDLKANVNYAPIVYTSHYLRSSTKTEYVCPPPQYLSYLERYAIGTYHNRSVRGMVFPFENLHLDIDGVLGIYINGGASIEEVRRSVYLRMNQYYLEKASKYMRDYVRTQNQWDYEDAIKWNKQFKTAAQINECLKQERELAAQFSATGCNNIYLSGLFFHWFKLDNWSNDVLVVGNMTHSIDKSHSCGVAWVMSRLTLCKN